MAIKLHQEIFREYDIRGYVDRELSTDFAYLLGRAFSELAKGEKVNQIAIGHDCRLSSPDYAESLAKGLADEGINCTIFGMGPTPQLYFSVFAKNLGGGIQVTGSHNPSDMNGFKLLIGKRTLSGADIQDLYTRMERLNSTSASAPGTGSISREDIREQYIAEIVARCSEKMGKRKLKVVVDAGNGVGGLVGPEVLRRLGCEVIELFCEPDGRFPNHHPDPTVLKNIQTLIEKVRETKADLGIGWDGDADRIGAVDENGEVIFGDMLLLLYGRAVLKEVPGATIIGDVKCSSRLFSDLKSRGANAIMWKTGHSLIKGKLSETNGHLAGEMSGHIFFKHRYFGFDDALYSSARLVEILSNSDLPLSKMLSDLPPMVSTPEIRVDCPEKIKFKIPELLRFAFSNYKCDLIDGIRINFEKGWGLVRASNTQPVLVMRFEAEDNASLESYQKQVTEAVDKVTAGIE